MFEMFFYFVFMIALLLRVNVLHFCAAVLTVFAIASAFSRNDGPSGTVYLNPIVLYFLVGMVIGHWALGGKLLSALIWLALPFTIWIGLTIFTGGSVADLARHLCVAALVAAVVALEPVLGGLIPGPVVFLGNASYSLYLFHPLIAGG